MGPFIPPTFIDNPGLALLKFKKKYKFHKLFVTNEQFQANHDILRQEIADIF